MTLIIGRKDRHSANALTQSQLDLLTQIVVRDSEQCYLRNPIGADVIRLVERGYLRVADHKGLAVLKPTAAGERAVGRGIDVVV